jgi:hypothetical protein
MSSARAAGGRAWRRALSAASISSKVTTGGNALEPSPCPSASLASLSSRKPWPRTGREHQRQLRERTITSAVKTRYVVRLHLCPARAACRRATNTDTMTATAATESGMIRFSYGWFRDQDAVGVDVSGAAWPARFEIRLDRVMEPRWSEWFGGLEVESDADETIFRGTVRDRSALQGLLDKAADLGLSVPSVLRLPLVGPARDQP